MLAQHPWRGNIRELKNAVERVVLLEDDVRIEATHLTFLLPPGQRASQEGGISSLPTEGVQLDELIKTLIVQALERCGGNKAQAARLLGISRPTLVYRLEKHGITGS